MTICRKFTCLGKYQITTDTFQVICISRRGKVILPTGKDCILPDDRVVVVTKHKGLSDLDDIVGRR